MKLIKISLPIILLTYLFSSCVEEEKKPTLDTTLIMGKWVLTKATLDKRKTNRLDSAYMVFQPDGVLETNILGSDEKGTYEIKESNLTQKTGKTLEHKIEKLVSDSLIMNFKFNEKQFRVLLQK